MISQSRPTLNQLSFGICENFKTNKFHKRTEETIERLKITPSHEIKSLIHNVWRSEHINESFSNLCVFWVEGKRSEYENVYP